MYRVFCQAFLIVLFGLSLMGFVQKFDFAKSIERGKEVYTSYCQNCHMQDGNGLAGAFPPLAKSDYLKKPAGQLINIILKGQSGEITVNGTKYNVPMPAQDNLSDEQISDVLNYVRNSWTNKASIPITPSQVKTERK